MEDDRTAQEEQPHSNSSGNELPVSTSGLAIAGLVLGILAILGAVVPLLNILTMPFSLVGLPLAFAGFIGIRRGKHIGRGIATAGIVLNVLALVLTFGMYGCAGAASHSTDAASSAQGEAEEPSSNADSQSSGSATEMEGKEKSDNADKAQADDSAKAGLTTQDYVGTWELVEAISNGTHYDEATMDAARSKGIETFVNVYDDGTYAICSTGETTSVLHGSWTGDEEGTLRLAPSDSDHAEVVFVVDGQTAQNRYMMLRKAKSMREEPETTQDAYAADEEDQPSNEGGVSADVKEALDSYEAFIDEYVAFMQRFGETDDTTAMMLDYADFLSRYADFSQKIDAMDTDDMSEADYAYYLEVTSRCAQKLLEASV